MNEMNNNLPNPPLIGSGSVCLINDDMLLNEVKMNSASLTGVGVGNNEIELNESRMSSVSLMNAGGVVVDGVGENVVNGMVNSASLTGAGDAGYKVPSNSNQTSNHIDSETESYTGTVNLNDSELTIGLPHSSPHTTSTASSCSSLPQTRPRVISARSWGIGVDESKAAPITFTGTSDIKDTESCIYMNPAILNNQVQDFSRLNRSDIGELFQHQDILTTDQTNLLKTVQRKRELYPQRYRDDYLRHSSILLLSNGWSSSLRYSMCSVPNAVNRSGQCKLHKYCQYCSFMARQRALIRYVPAYESGIWHFLTGSFTGDLTMNTPADYYDLLNYWDAYKLALRNLVKLKLIRGVFWTEELAVNSIAPTRVLPHIHATIEADSMDDETIRILKSSVVANLKTTLGPDCLAPNIQVKNLNSQRKLLSHVQYQIKPIKLVKAYDLAWSRAVHNDRAGAVNLNSQTTDLVLGYSCATKDRTKINYAGNLSPKAKMYIGTRDRDMKEAQAVVRSVIKEGSDYIELDGQEEITATE